MKKSMYFYTNGTLKRHENTLQFISAENEKKHLPIEQIDDIYVFGEMNINTKLINFLSQHGIIVHFFNYYTFYTGSFYPKESAVSGNLLVNQVKYYTDSEMRLSLAIKFIEAAAVNIYRNLRYYNGRGKNVEEGMKLIERLQRKIPNCKSVQELMGIEGNIRKIYYDSWQNIISQEFEFEKRVKNPPDNIVNTLISYINTLIYTRVLGEIYSTQLNPTISYLHEPGTRRFSLSLDIAEIFKPLIGDRLIFSLLNKRQISQKHFSKELNYLHLTKAGSQIILKEFDERLAKTIKHKTLGRSVSYKQLIRLECYKLIKHLIGEKEYEGFTIWW